MQLNLKQATTIPAGVALLLSAAQIESRAHALEKYDEEDDVYVSIQTLEFKAGETVEVAGDLPKGILPAYDLALAEAELEAAKEQIESSKAADDLNKTV